MLTAAKPNSSKEQSSKFQKILNKWDKEVQLAIADENEEKYLHFLGRKIKNNKERYEFNFYPKSTTKNIQIKHHACILLSIIISVFKGFLARSTKICF